MIKTTHRILIIYGQIPEKNAPCPSVWILIIYGQLILQSRGKEEWATLDSNQ